MEKKMPPESTKIEATSKPEGQTTSAPQTTRPPPIQLQTTRIITQQPSFTKLPPNDLYRKLLPAGLFLLTFVSVMTILLVYMDTTALRAQQFRMNMTRDYELTRIAQDNPALIAYVRQLHLGGRFHHHHYTDADGGNQQDISPPDDDKIRLIESLTGNKEKGNFMEILIGGGRDPVTMWLQQTRSWSGLVVRADPEDALMLKSASPPNINTLHACLSPTPHPKEVTYYESLREWSEDGVSVNSLESMDSHGFNSRVMCFPLLTLMLVVNETKCDYVVISSPGDQLAVLETVPWTKVDIKILEIRIPKGPSRISTTRFLQTKGYIVRAQFDDAIVYIKPSEVPKM